MTDSSDSGRKLRARREKILSDPRIARLIVELSLPLFVSGSLQSLYSIIDTFWLSLLGPAALGTPTVSWPYRGVLMSIGFGLASAVSALAGQYIGAGEYRKASRSVGSVLGLLLAIGVPASLGFLLFRDLYLDAISVTSDIRPLADAYIAVTMAGVPFMYTFLVFNFAIGAAGDTSTPMKVSVVSTLLNFVLDPLLIFPAGLGVVGAALATLISNMVAGLYGAYSFATGRHGIKLGLKDLAPAREYLSKIASISLPPIGERFFTTLGFIVMMRIVNGLGTAIVAAYSIGQVVLNLDHVIVFPLVRSTSIVVAQSLGAQLYERAKRAAKTGLGLILGLVLAYILGIIIIKDYFIGVFTSDPEVWSAADRMLLVFGPSVLGFNLFILAGSIARASGHTLLVSLLGISRLWLIRIPLSWYLAYVAGLGDLGLWAGMAVSNWAIGLAATAWILSWTWAKPVIEVPGVRGLEKLGGERKKLNSGLGLD